ncbi:TonB-dependent receptor [Sessilibacter sp. MAH4]
MTRSPSVLGTTLSLPFNLLAFAVGVALAPLSFAEQDSKIIEEVIVEADGSQIYQTRPYAGGQVARGSRAGILGNLDLLNAPFSSTAYTEELIHNQQSRSIADVVQNDPSVRPARGFGNFQEVYIIRGFPVFSDDMTFNGLYGVLPRQFVAAELVERVEVFRGANSFINGAAPGGSATGGAVNLVPKRASDNSSRISLGLEAPSQYSAAFDTSVRFGNNENSGLRISGVRRDGETSIEDQERELNALSISFDHSGDRYRFTADLGYQDHHIDAPRPSVTPLGEIPDTPDADSNFAQPWTFTDEKQLFGVFRGEFDIQDNITAWAAIGGRDGEEENVLANPSAFADGSTTFFRFDNTREDTIISSDAGIRFEFNTGDVAHRLITSVSRYSLESKNAFAFSNFAGFSGDLNNPFTVEIPPADFFLGGDLKNPRVTEDNDTFSYAIADIITLPDEKTLLTLGLRSQTLKVNAFDNTTGARTSSYDESKTTPVVGIVYKALPEISLYANYAESLSAGETAPTVSGGEAVINSGEVFEPSVSEQFEIGFKFDYQTIGGSVSLYQIDQPVFFVENNRFGENGKQVNTGVELSIFGQLNANTKIVGGYTYTDADQKDTQDSSVEGKDAVGIPNHQFNINLEHALNNQLSIDGRFVYTSSQYADAANTLEVDGWNRLDLGTRYQTNILGKNTQFSLRIENVFNEDYWASVGGFPGANYLVLGNPRTVLLSASFNL